MHASRAPPTDEADLNNLMARTDTNSDGQVTAAEMNTMMAKLDISDATVTQTCNCGGTTALVSKYDADASGGLTRSELIALIQGEPDLGKSMAAKITNAPDPKAIGSMAATMFTPKAETLAATAKVSAELKISADKIFPGERKAIQAKFASLFSVPEASVIMRYIQGTAAAASSRRLEESSSTRAGRALAATEWTITATAFVADSSAAAAAEAQVQAELGDPATASTSLGMTVTSAATTTTGDVVGMAPMPWGSLALLAIFVLIILVSSIAASSCAKRQRAKSNVESDGKCCVTGCCSYYAVPTWAKTDLGVAAFLAIAAFLVFGRVSSFVAGIRCLFNQILSLSSVGGQASQLGASIPVSQISQAISLLDLLPIVAIFPGIVSAILMLVIAICGNTKCYTHCCFKFATVIVMVPLILSVVCAIVFIGVNAIFYVPMLQAELRKITALCDTALPVLQQTMDDAQVLVDTLKTASLGDATAVSSAEEALASGSMAVTVFEEVCRCFTGLLSDIQGLMTPSILMLVASLSGLWTAFGSCCSACCNPIPGDMTKVTPSA